MTGAMSRFWPSPSRRSENNKTGPSGEAAQSNGSLDSARHPGSSFRLSRDSQAPSGGAGRAGCSAKPPAWAQRKNRSPARALSSAEA